MIFDKEVFDISTDITNIIASLSGKSENLSGIIKELPSTNVIINILKTANSISNYIIAKKYLSFAKQISEHNIHEKSLYEMLNKYHLEKKNFSEQILLALDKCDTIDKTKLIGDLTADFLNYNITYNEFDHFLFSINNLPLYILKELSQSYNDGQYVANQEVFGFLQANGLCSMLNPNGDFLLGGSSKISMLFHLNKHGEKFGKLLEKYFQQ